MYLGCLHAYNIMTMSLYHKGLMDLGHITLILSSPVATPMQQNSLVCNKDMYSNVDNTSLVGQPLHKKGMGWSTRLGQHCACILIKFNYYKASRVFSPGLNFASII